MKTFKFENKKVRIKILDDEIWFVADDVTDILGYGVPVKAIRNHVDDEDKRLEEEIPLINESGLYNLIFASNLTIAMKFKKWVISEVLSKFRNYENDETHKQTQIDDLISDYYDHYVKYLEKNIDEKIKLINESYEIVKRIKNTY